MLIIIVFFGAEKIPEIARGLGKGIRELKDATNTIKQEILDSSDASELIDDTKKSIDEIKEDISEVTNSIKRMK
ncbi:Sec-independent translocation protein mttA/Hcf106 [Ichthyobacterium seriolicida]|uniref:Sec-independent translocation protein mttA/Hcf106 n=2 Tax=Ichthyobacterium seriolicida TaxID=242600 RepID=A0A1J1DYR6_9FLAO|nr:Sec-independent translocation protein mttA/Hcf106 [Ichthyobacterium seriolicida]